MKLNIPLFKHWDITFEEDCISKNRDISIPQYIPINELKEKIMSNVIETGSSNKYFKKKPCETTWLLGLSMIILLFNYIIYIREW
jgi:hypothetical protein